MGKKPDYSDATFWGKQLARAQANDQYGFYPHEPKTLVYTASDLGNRHTVVWFFQYYQDTFRMINFYYDSGGEGLPANAALMQRLSMENHYRYAQHFVPWDFGGGDARDKAGPNGKSFQTGKFLLDVAEEIGLSLTAINQFSRETQIMQAGDMIGRFRFNENTTQEGWEGLRGYRKKKDEARSTTDKPMYHKEPIKDWTEHVGSAFCTVTMAILDELEVDGVMIGSPNPVAALKARYGQESQQPAYDVFTRGVRRMGG